MKISSAFLVLLFAGSSCFPKTYKPAPKTAAANRYISIANMDREIIGYVNAYRKQKGLSPLILLPTAAIEAKRHSVEMASKKLAFGHAGFDHRAAVIDKALKGTSSTGENVAYGRMTAFEVLTTWLKSKGHRENIEGNFNYTGVGVAKDSQGVIYYTQIFAKK